MGSEHFEKTMFMELDPHLDSEVKELIGHPFGGKIDVFVLSFSHHASEGRVQTEKPQATDAGNAVVVYYSF